MKVSERIRLAALPPGVNIPRSREQWSLYDVEGSKETAAKLTRTLESMLSDIYKRYQKGESDLDAIIEASGDQGAKDGETEVAVRNAIRKFFQSLAK